MRTAEVYAEVFNVQCPYCEEPVTGTNGSFSICHATNAPTGLEAGKTWKCQECGHTFRMPARTMY